MRYEKGKAVKEPAPDMDCVIRAILDAVTGAVQDAYGVQTGVTITAARAADIRLSGTFTEKPGVIRERVGGVLAEAFDGLDLGGE